MTTTNFHVPKIPTADDYDRYARWAQLAEELEPFEGGLHLTVDDFEPDFVEDARQFAADFGVSFPASLDEARAFWDAHRYEFLPFA